MKSSTPHILVIAPSGRLEKDSLKEPLGLLMEKGCRVELGENVSKVYGPFAGRDSERLTDIQWALNHNDADIIWMARGGYGLTRIIDNIKPDGFVQKPKLIIGYSDISTLFLHPFFEDYELIHGPMLQSILESEIDMVLDLISERKQSLDCHSNKEEMAIMAKITGGNLSLIVNQLGIIDNSFFRDKVLFIEEVSEYDYKIDRMLVQLQRSGILKNIKALMLGQLSDINPGRYPIGNMQEIILERMTENNIPVIFGISSGHDKPNIPLYFNTMAEMKYSAGKLNINYSPSALV